MQEKQPKKQRKKKQSNYSDSETNEAPAHSHGHRQDNQTPQPQQPRLPPFTALELQQAFQHPVEEKQVPEKRKSLALETTAHTILNYINGAFNQLRLNTSFTFKGLQGQAKFEEQAVQPAVDYQRSDVYFSNYLALFKLLQLDQLDPMT